MRKFVLAMFLALAMFFSVTTLWAESLPVPAVEDYRLASSPSNKTPQPFVEEKKPTIEKRESYPNKEFYPTSKYDPKASVTHNEKGDLYLKKGMYYAAIEEYKKAIASDPNNAIAHFNLSIPYDKKGMKEEAAAEYAIYKRLKPATDVRFAEMVNGEKVSNKDTMNKNDEAEQTELEEAEAEAEIETLTIKDPIQPFNKAMFTFNDKAFHYFFKPIYTGYNFIVPEKARVSVRNFYTNIRMPIRFFNCLFQYNLKGAGTEMLRFVINSTIGGAGFFDPAKSKFQLEKQEKDFGQTLGKYKMDSGTYIVWPFIGPSNTRDTIGLVGDAALNPLTWVSYFFLTTIEGVGTYTYDAVNDTSIDKGSTYESITKAAIDPYIAVQDAYIQNRIKKIKE